MAESLIIGASGQVGSELRRLLPNSEGTACFNRMCDDSLIKLDLNDFNQTKVLIKALKPKYIFLCAAWTGVDSCEGDPQASRRVNVEGSQAVAQAAESIDATLIFFSTNYVFDGEGSEPYTTDSLPNPINEYGRQKLAAEHYILSRMNRSIIIRTSTVFGLSETGFVHRMVKGLKVVGKVTVSNEMTSPTYVYALAKVLPDLVCDSESNKKIFNICGRAKITKVDFARMIARTWGLDEKMVEEVPSEGVEVKRPANGLLKPCITVGESLQIDLQTVRSKMSKCAE